MTTILTVIIRPVASLLITGEGHFPPILGLFQGLKNGVRSGSLGKHRFLK